MVRFGKIRRLHDKEKKALAEHGHRSKEYIKIRDQISAELMMIRFTARIIERLCDTVRGMVEQVRRHEREIVNLSVNKAQMPRVPHGTYNGLVVSPLRSARLDPPDICMFYGTPGQMIYFINGLQFHRYRRYDFTVTGESACADSWGRALATRQTSLSLPCFAERRYGGVADDELRAVLERAIAKSLSRPETR